MILPRRARLAVSATAVLVAVAVPMLARHAAARDAATAVRAVAAERAVVDADIVFYEARVAADTLGAADRLSLAALLARRGRLTGNPGDWLRAEALARQSLALRQGRNTAAWGTLAAALVAQHRFTAADSAAASMVQAEPWRAAHRAQRAEILLQLGDTLAAGATFDSVRAFARQPAVAPRYAQWLELTGRHDGARALLRLALDSAHARRSVTREQLAWYHWRLGDFELRHGNLRAADRVLAAGLRVAPGDYRLIGAQARLAAARGDWPDAVRLGEDALVAAPELAVLRALAEAYAAVGDSARAADARRVIAITLAADSAARRSTR